MILEFGPLPFVVVETEDLYTKRLLERVRSEVDAFVDQIESVRGSDMEWVLLRTSEQTERLRIIKQISAKATSRFQSLCVSVIESPMIFDTRQTIDQRPSTFNEFLEQ